MVAWLAIAVLAGHVVEVSAGTCTSSAAIEAALAARVPTPLTVEVRSTLEGLSVRVQAEGQAPVERALGPASEPCPLVPDLIALVAERYVRALPRRDWIPRAPAAAPDPTPRPTLTRTPPSRRPSSTLNAGADLAASLGLGALSPGGDLGLHLALGGARFGAAGVAGLRLIPRIAFGPGGTLRITAPRAGLAAFVQMPPADALRWQVALTGGAYFAQAAGFEGSRSKTLPLLEFSTRWVLELPAGLYAGLGLQIPLLRPQLERVTSDVVYREPAVRLSLLIGFARALAFF